MNDNSKWLTVPVRAVASMDGMTILTGRLPDGGQRVAIAFTDTRLLIAALGTHQRSITLHESALRAMVAPLGITRIQVDPVLVAPDVTPSSAPQVTRVPAGAAVRPA